MTVGDGWTSRLIAGLAQHIADAGIGVWRPPPGAAYAAGEVGILDRAVPPVPDRVITLAMYPVGQAYQGLADVTVGVQIRTRGTTDPRVCDDLADALYDLLDSASGLRLGGIAVVQLYRQSYASLGQDNNNRWERSDNYYVDAMRPTANNTD